MSVSAGKLLLLLAVYKSVVSAANITIGGVGYSASGSHVLQLELVWWQIFW